MDIGTYYLGVVLVRFLTSLKFSYFTGSVNIFSIKFYFHANFRIIGIRFYITPLLINYPCINTTTTIANIYMVTILNCFPHIPIQGLLMCLPLCAFFSFSSTDLSKYFYSFVFLKNILYLNMLYWSNVLFKLFLLQLCYFFHFFVFDFLVSIHFFFYLP